MTLVLVAHGTHDPRGAAVVEEIATLVRARLRNAPVVVAYADVRQPDLTAVLRTARGPVVVVPAFLAAGFHVRVDLPRQVTASGHDDVVVTDPIGPALLPAVWKRLREAGWQPTDAVVLAAAGSSDPRALADVTRVAAKLGTTLGYLTTAYPSVSTAVAELSAQGRRVAVAPWLLTPGVFHRRLATVGADLVAEPIGAHRSVVDAVLLRYHAQRDRQRRVTTEPWRSH